MKTYVTVIATIFSLSSLVIASSPQMHTRARTITSAYKSFASPATRLRGLTEFRPEETVKKEEDEPVIVSILTDGHRETVTVETPELLNLKLLTAAKHGNLEYFMDPVPSSSNFGTSINPYNSTLAASVNPYISSPYISSPYSSAKAVIRASADINTRDKSGMTALMIACQLGHVQFAQKLVDQDAEINLQSNNGNTALMWVFTTAGDHSSAPKTVDVITKLCCLLVKNSDLNIRNNDGETVLIKAIKANCDKTILSILLAPHTRINLPDSKKITPLMWALRCNNKFAVNALLSDFADVESPNEKNETLLTLIAKKPEMQKIWETQFMAEYKQRKAAQKNYTNLLLQSLTFLSVQNGTNDTAAKPESGKKIAKIIAEYL